MRSWARMTGAAVAVSAALLMSGCTEDTGTNGGNEGSSAEEKPAQESSDQGGGENGEETAAEPVVGPVDVADVKGNWETGSVMDGDYVVLNLTGDSVAVVVTEEATCNGTYAQDGDNVGLELQCRRGSGFEEGTVKGVGDGEMTVAWSSGETDVFTPTD